MTKVINLLGAPGSGKSTTACQLFAELKLRGVNCELVREYAKDKVWERSTSILEDQIYVFAKQNHRQRILVGKVDYIITDSSLLNSLIYGDEGATFSDFVLETFNTYDNINIVVDRVKKYDSQGRMQTECESEVIHTDIINMLEDLCLDYKRVNGDIEASKNIISVVGVN